MTAHEWLSDIMLSAALANLAMFLLGWWQYRRMMLLYRLLGQLCVNAFVNQHLPIWVPWAHAFGYDFKLSVNDADADEKGQGDGRSKLS